MRQSLAVLFLLACALCAAAIRAAEPVQLDIAYLGMGSVDADPRQLRVRAIPAAHPRGVRDLGDGSWWRLRVRDATSLTDDRWVLYFRNVHPWSELSLVQDGAEQPQVRRLYRQPIPPWAAPRDLPILLTANTDLRQALYLHVADPGKPLIGVQVLPRDRYLERAAAHNALATACTASLLTMALLALGFRRGFGAGAYGNLALMALSAALYVQLSGGELLRMVGAEWLETVAHPLHRTAGMLAAAFSLLFIVGFLELRNQRPRSRRVIETLAMLQVGCAVLNWFEPFRSNSWTPNIANLGTLLAIGMVLVEAIHAHRRGLHAGRFVLLAWTPALFILTVWIAVLQGWVPLYGELALWAYVGLTTQVGILCLGLADDGMKLIRERDLAAERADRDPLTGVLNRGALRRKLELLFRDARSTGAPLSVAFADLDHFKRINDTLGHAVGDHCLRRFVEIARLHAREVDILARYGGEEFVLVLPGMSGADARQFADRLRIAIANTRFDVDGQAVRLTVSFGVAEMNEATYAPDLLLERADKALYRSKSQGRNRVTVHSIHALGA